MKTVTTFAITFIITIIFGSCVDQNIIKNKRYEVIDKNINLRRPKRSPNDLFSSDISDVKRTDHISSPLDIYSEHRAQIFQKYTFRRQELEFTIKPVAAFEDKSPFQNYLLILIILTKSRYRCMKNKKLSGKLALDAVGEVT
ncbi:uncharacterized protein LOC128199200 [Bicyclus anynana]|uniref:Uncharacterized protein LOC128199200 n=1 Tax=Bicyclus anynana TaxID=110368 RepID=A0ABM3LX23_BICAN|nr:uncharacterized protein LOC128199200 [Bicyclus anynana]